MSITINGSTGISGVDGSAGTPALQGSDSNTGIRFGTDIVSLVTGGGDRLYIDSSGKVGIGTSTPESYGVAVQLAVGNPSGNGSVSILAGSANNGSLYFADGTVSTQTYRGYFQYRHATDSLAIGTSATDRVIIDSSGRLLVGTNAASRDVCAIFAGGTGGNPGAIQIESLASTPTSGADIGVLNWTGGNGNRGAMILCTAGSNWSASNAEAYLSIQTTPNGVTSPRERIRIKANGVVSIGDWHTSPNYHRINYKVTQENPILVISAYDAVNTDTAIFYSVNVWNANSSAAAMQIGRHSTNLRSINAGGTVNASGADYAEYMTKSGNFIIAKGDICGVTVDGKLTVNFADSISFVVKSTEPSYVGGDTWGSEDIIGVKPDTSNADDLSQWEARLENARQQVDRIAFAGQVPVNVLGAVPGQYIIPIQSIDGGIEGIAKNETDLTLAEYMSAVGKVVAIEDDGRARIIVKVA